MHDDAPTQPPASFHSDVTLALARGAGGRADARAPAGYVIEKELGRGGMGVVYLARSVALQRPCALKMILSGVHADRADVARFATEAQAIARVQHPGIVQVFEVGEHDGLPFLALEYCGGGSLSATLAKGALKPMAAAALVQALAAAAQAAHDAMVVHRDLKPANVLLTEKGDPKITDFGLAKKLDEAGATRTGRVMGTASYMPPEQAEGRKDVGPLADVYALGAILYECLAARPPFAAASPLDTLVQVLSEDPVPLRQLNHQVPADLETIAHKCLQKDPARRYATASELGDDLGRWLADEPIRARPVGAAERAVKWVRRNRTVSLLVAAVVSALALGLAVSVALGLRVAAHAARADENADQLGAKVVELQAARTETEKARLDALDQLRASYLAQAGALRRAREPGRRHRSLAALKESAALARQLGSSADHLLALRNEAVAAMALPVDARVDRRWPNPGPPDHERTTFSPTLDHYAAHLGGGEVGVFRTADAGLVVKLLGPSGIGATQLAFSPDGKHLAAVYVNTRVPGHRIDEYRVWDWREGKALVQRTRESHPMGWFVWAPDGRYTIRTPHLPTLLVSAVSAGEKDVTVPVGVGWTSCAFFPQGDRLALVGGKSAVVRDVKADAVVAKWTLPAPAFDVAVHPDGRQVATVHARYVLLWDLGNLAAPVKFDGHERDVRCARFHGRGDLIVTASWDESIRFWDTATGRQLLALPGTASDLVFSPDGRRLAARQGVNDLALIDILGEGELRPIRPDVAVPDGVSDLTWSPDGRVLATANADGIRLWSEDGRMLARLTRTWGRSILFDPKGRHLFALEPTRVVGWPLTTEPDAVRFGPPRSAPLTPATGLIGRLAMDAGGTRLAVCDFNGGRVLVFPDGDLTATPHALALPEPVSCAVSPDGRWVAAAEYQRFHPEKGMTLRVWDAATGVVVAPRLYDRRCNVFFSADGARLVAGDSEAYRSWEVGRWDRPTVVASRVASSATSHGEMAFSPDGRVVAVAHSQWRAQLLDAATGRQVVTLESPEERQITRITFSPDGSRLVVGRDGSAAQVWDLAAIGSQLEGLGLADGFPRVGRRPTGRPPRVVGPPES